MTYLHTHLWATGNQHLLKVYIVLLYLLFIVYLFISVSMIGNNQQVSAYWICYQLWNVRMIEHQLEVGVDSVSPWRPDATVYVMWRLIWLSKVTPLISEMQPFKGRQDKEDKRSLAVHVCVSTAVAFTYI